MFQQDDLIRDMMVIKVLIGLLAIAAFVAIYGLFKMPESFTVQRSLAFKASPEALFPYINNAKLAQQWNPFTEGDTTLKLNFSGPTEGVGSETSWVGNKDSGEGKITITESEANRRVAIRLDFEKPFKGTNFGEYKLEANDGGTLMTQSITEKSFPPRFISVFVDLDKMIGTKFEKGLANLKTLTEQPAKN